MLTQTIKLPPRSQDAWRWENYKARAALKGLVTDVTPAIVGSRKQQVKSIAELVGEVRAL